MLPFINRSRRRVSAFVHSVLFGRKNLLLTNTVLSASMGAIGDSIVQNYDIMMETLQDRSKNDQKLPSFEDSNTSTSPITPYNFIRTGHMTVAGLTTGLTTHYWYIILDRLIGTARTPLNLVRKILLDQIIFSPANLVVYFGTLGLCERSGLRHIMTELVEKGFEDIYLAEWFIWPPAQLINFALLPLRYRILFDNFVSLGFDIYSPYVKYKKELVATNTNTKNTKNTKKNDEQEEHDSVYWEHNENIACFIIL